MTCKVCGANLSEYAKFCPECGTIVQESQNKPYMDDKTENIVQGLHCPVCQNPVGPDDVFCASCGATLSEIKNKNDGSKNNSTKLAILISSLIAFAAVAAVGGVLLINSWDKKDSDDIAKETSSAVAASSAATAAPPTPVPTPAPTPVPAPPVFTNVSASSTRGTDYTSGSPVNYYPSYAVDGLYETAWSCDRNIELTPTITLSADTPQYVTGVKVANGYFKSMTTYTRNRRITEFLIEYDGGQVSYSCGVDQYRIMQDIRLPAPVYTSYISVHVVDSYYGDWKDINISEIEVY